MGIEHYYCDWSGTRDRHLYCDWDRNYGRNEHGDYDYDRGSMVGNCNEEHGLDRLVSARILLSRDGSENGSCCSCFVLRSGCSYSDADSCCNENCDEEYDGRSSFRNWHSCSCWRDASAALPFKKVATLEPKLRSD